VTAERTRPGPRILGIPVRIHPTFFLVAALLGARPGASLASVSVWIAVVFASVLLHELGHAWTARWFGYRPRIELHAMGGTTLWGGAPVTPGRRLLISLAGPLAGLLVGALVWGLLPEAGLQGLARETVLAVLWVNVGWGVLNLLPVLPLDGGNVMASILDGLTGGRGERPARIASFLLAAAGLVVALLARQLWASFLAGLFAWWNLRAILEDVRRLRDAPLEQLLEVAGERLSARDLPTAGRLAGEVLERARTPETRIAATQLLVLAHLAGGEAGKARALLADLPPGAVAPAVEIAVLLGSGDERGVEVTREALERDRDGAFAGALARTLLLGGLVAHAGALFAGPRADQLDPPVLAELQAALFYDGRFDASARIGERLFERMKQPITAYNVACALSRGGDPDHALAWLERALSAGLDPAVDVDRDPDLAPVRSLPGYAELLARFPSRPSATAE
jgi:Zn-dependent protease